MYYVPASIWCCHWKDFFESMSSVDSNSVKHNSNLFLLFICWRRWRNNNKRDIPWTCSYLFSNLPWTNEHLNTAFLAGVEWLWFFWDDFSLTLFLTTFIPQIVLPTCHTQISTLSFHHLQHRQHYPSTLFCNRALTWKYKARRREKNAKHGSYCGKLFILSTTAMYSTKQHIESNTANFYFCLTHKCCILHERCIKTSSSPS
jgi:hypothetical protein